MKYDKYVLWLPSWYPNLLEPLNGDFIQRHAQATSLFCNITVMHFTQYGEGVKQEKTFETISTSNQLKEVVSYIAFKPTGIRLLDKLRYNYAYYQHAKKYLAAYFEKFGLPESVHVHVPMKAGNLALWIKRKYGINYIVSEHSSYYLKSATGNYFERSFLYRKQVNVIFKGAQAVTNVSSTIGNLLCQLFQLKTVRTVHNVVNTEYFNYSASRNQLFTYIHVSTLNEQKNINGILQVFSKLMAFKSDWKLVLVGPYTNDLIKKIREFNLQDHIELTGEISYQDVARHLKKSHVKVLFSRHENFPCVVVEALCCGLPVVAADVAGVKEAINETNGILVTSEDEEQLLKALIQVREQFESYNTEAISNEAIEKYNYKVIGRQIFNLYSGDLRN